MQFISYRNCLCVEAESTILYVSIWSDHIPIKRNSRVFGLMQIHIFIDVKKVLNRLIWHIWPHTLNYSVRVHAQVFPLFRSLSSYKVKNQKKNMWLILSLFIFKLEWNGHWPIPISEFVHLHWKTTGSNSNSKSRGIKNNMTEEFFRKWITFYGDYLLTCLCYHHFICSLLHFGVILCLLTNCACPI